MAKKAAKPIKAKVIGETQPLGYVQMTSLGSAVSLTSIPAGATKVVMQSEAQDVRFRDDGTNPTAAIGMILEVKKPWTYEGDLKRIKVIEAAGSGKLNLMYYA